MWQPILRCRGLALCIIFAVVAVTMLVPGTAISKVDVTLEVKRDMKFGEFAADISVGGTVVLSAFADTVTQSGPITNFGGTVTRARVQINGQNRAYVIVSLPSSITIRKRLKLPAVASRTVEIGNDGTILNGNDFVIGEKPKGALEVRVLLASFSTVAEAEAAWEEMKAALPNVFQDIESDIVEHEAKDGKAAFVDLYALPFESREAAQAACIDLQAKFGDTLCNPLDISIK